MHWRIWYKGNVKVDGSTAADWAAAPDDGVIGIVVKFGIDEYQSPLNEWISGSDWYWMYNDNIYQSNSSSDVPGEWLPHNAPAGAVLKTGRWTSEAELAQIDAEMLEYIK